jgi:hypothetical protein
MKVFYIGKTSKEPLQRYQEHIGIAGNTPKQLMIKEIYETTGQDPDLTVLETGILDGKSAFTREVYWIEVFRSSGTILTNASIDYNGVYFLTDDHLGSKHKYGEFSFDISIEKLNEFYNNKENFQIELFSTFTPIKTSQTKSIKDFNRKRYLNSKAGRLINHGMPYTVEEIMLVQQRCNQGDDIEKLKRFFQRSEFSITFMLEYKFKL